MLGSRGRGGVRRHCLCWVPVRPGLSLPGFSVTRVCGSVLARMFLSFLVSTSLLRVPVLSVEASPGPCSQPAFASAALSPLFWPPTQAGPQPCSPGLALPSALGRKPLCRSRLLRGAVSNQCPISAHAPHHPLARVCLAPAPGSLPCLRPEEVGQAGLSPEGSQRCRCGGHWVPWTTTSS